MKGKKYSWTLGLVLGIVLLVHFAVSMFNEIFKVTDIVRRYKNPEIMLFVIWTLLTLSTVYSVLTFLSRDVRIKMNIESNQYRWTLIAKLSDRNACRYFSVKRMVLDLTWNTAPNKMYKTWLGRGVNFVVWLS